LLTQQLQSLPPGTGALAGEPLKIEGHDRDELSWVCPAGPGLLTRYATGDFQVSLRLRPHDAKSRQLDLGLLRKPKDDTAVSNEHETWVRLIDNVGTLQIRFFDSRLNTWVQRWTDTVTLPRLVKVVIRSHRCDRAQGNHRAACTNAVMKPSKSRGAALLLSLWALFLLAALVMSWALNIDSRLNISGTENRILEAQAMAASGAEVAITPTINPNSPNLQGKFGPRQSYSVRITGEGGRLNINWLVAGENPARIEILRQYLEAKGIDLNERDRMIDCLLDWVDPDDLVRLNGAEASEGYQPGQCIIRSGSTS
jgi:hypothetical protein